MDNMSRTSHAGHRIVPPSFNGLMVNSVTKGGTRPKDSCNIHICPVHCLALVEHYLMVTSDFRFSHFRGFSQKASVLSALNNDFVCIED
jgi:hypothetical protein